MFQLWCLKPSGFPSYHTTTLLMTISDFFFTEANGHIIFYPLLHVALILTPWNVPFSAFMIPAACAFPPISHPCVLSILCWLLITTCVWILMSQGLSFTLLSPHTFWAALRLSTFCLHLLYVLAPRFQILSRSVLFNIVAASNMWPFKLKISK